MGDPKKTKKQEVIEESETTENEFSELDVKNEVRKRVAAFSGQSFLKHFLGS